jgi:uncharacterized repeat protein (TIGR02543 family)
MISARLLPVALIAALMTFIPNAVVPSMISKAQADPIGITWDGNGGTVNTAGASLTTDFDGEFYADQGTQLVRPETATREGYSFIGWFAQPVADQENCGIGVEGFCNSFVIQDGKLVFYARWQPQTHVVIWDFQGGSIVDVDDNRINTSYTTGELLQNIPADPTKAGYVFAGWRPRLDRNDVVNVHTASPLNNFNSDSSKAYPDITLYARWNVPITYDSQGGSAISDNAPTAHETVVFPGTPTRYRYTFNGWFEAATGGSAKVFPFESFRQAAYTLYAQWTAPSTDATLSALAISSGVLSPAFDSATLSYTASVSTSTITITPTKSNSGATFAQYLGATGANAFTGALSAGPNIIRTVVTAQNGLATKTYTVTVTLLPTLSALILLGGPLAPTFTSSTKNYRASVVNATSTTTITPTITSGTNATIKVNGTTVTSGSASGAISLEVGTNNVIQIVVTAQDGTTTNTYTITVTRTSNDATLRALDLSSGELSPTFTSGGTNYTASVSNPTITITPTPNQSGVTTVQYLGADGTTPFTGALNVGANVIRTVVTALNGSTTKTYTVTVTRIGVEEAPQVSRSSPTPSQASRTDVQGVKPVPVTPIPAPKVPATSPAPIPANSTLMKALSGNKNVKVTVADLIKLGVTGVKQSNLPTILQRLKGVDQTKLDVPTINKTVKAADAAIKKAEVAKTSKK